MRDKVEPLIDRATRELTKYGEAGVRSLSHVVMSDLGPTFAKFFGPEWVGGDSPAGVVCATINDYLEDYENVLVDYYLTKVALDLTARTVVAFFRSLDKNLNPSSTEKAGGKGLKLKQENVDRILDDMEVIEESLSTRMMGGPRRAGPFAMMDDMKVFLTEGGEPVLQAVAATSATITGAGVVKEGLRRAVEVCMTTLIKARRTASSLDKVTAKNLLNDCMEKIDEALESQGDNERPTFPGPYDKISLYMQVFGVKPQSTNKNTKDEKLRRGTIMHGAAAEEGSL